MRLPSVVMALLLLSPALPADAPGEPPAGKIAAKPLYRDPAPELAGRRVAPTGINDSGVILGTFQEDTWQDPASAFVAVPVAQP